MIALVVSTVAVFVATFALVSSVRRERTWRRRQRELATRLEGEIRDAQQMTATILQVVAVNDDVRMIRRVVDGILVRDMDRRGVLPALRSMVRGRLET